LTRSYLRGTKLEETKTVLDHVCGVGIFVPSSRRAWQNQDRRARSPLGRLRYFDGATTRELNGLKYLHATIDDSQIGRHLSGACAGDVPRRRLKSCVAATADDPRGGRDVRRDRGRSARQDP